MTSADLFGVLKPSGNGATIARTPPNQSQAMQHSSVLLFAVSFAFTGCFPQPSPDNSDASDDSGEHTSIPACNADAVCETWLATHNNFRADLNAGTVTDDGTDVTYPVPATPLPTLVWNEQLAEVAQAHADACVYEHNATRRDDYVNAGGENIYIGENIAVNGTTGTLAAFETYAEAQTEAWWEEHELWHYQPYQSGTINGAGHFTQMIWANTIEIGCGMASCPGILPGYTNAALGVCNYGPGGNYSGQHPYDIN